MKHFARRIKLFGLDRGYNSPVSAGPTTFFTAISLLRGAVYEGIIMLGCTTKNDVNYTGFTANVERSGSKV